MVRTLTETLCLNLTNEEACLHRLHLSFCNVHSSVRRDFCLSMCRQTETWEHLCVGNMDELGREFLVESCENLDQLDQDLVALERAPGSRELLGRVFRTIHTIKGACGFLAFGRLERLAHTGESLLSELRDGRRAMDPPTTDVLLHMVDTIREILASIEVSTGEGDTSVEDMIEAIRMDRQNPPRPGVPDLVLPVAQDANIPASPDSDVPDPEGDWPGSVRQRRRLDDRDVSRTDEVQVRASDSSIRVDVDVLDVLMRQVGELVLARNQITQFAGGQGDLDLLRASQRLSLIASELPEDVMRARMQPIDHLWATMPRVVCDLATDDRQPTRRTP